MTGTACGRRKMQDLSVRMTTISVVHHLVDTSKLTITVFLQCERSSFTTGGAGGPHGPIKVKI